MLFRDDDFKLCPLGTYVPHTVAALLRELRLTDASEEQQVAGITAWLCDHEPSPMMQRSLRRKGLADLLG